MLSGLRQRCYSTIQVPLKIYSLEGRYATALFTAASKKSELAGIEGEISKIKNAIEKSEQLKKLIENPTIGRDMKKTFVEQLLTKEKYSGTVVNFFKILAENGRLNLTGRVIASFEEIMKAKNGIVDVRITSAKDLSKEALDKVKETIVKKFIKPGQKLSVVSKVDASILGGIILQIGDQTVDMSTSTKLTKLKQSLNN